jgi:hypothetical protein
VRAVKRSKSKLSVSVEPVSATATRKEDGLLLVSFCGSVDKTNLCSKDVKSKISRGMCADKAKAKTATVSPENQPTASTSKVTL